MLASGIRWIHKVFGGVVLSNVLGLLGSGVYSRRTKHTTWQ
jgi:hypothetical protein